MKRALCFLIILTITLSIKIAFAQNVSSLGELVVTASRLQEQPEDVAQDVVVITAEDIKNKGVEFVTDVFKGLSDINLVQNGGFGKNASLFLRGGSANQVVIMIDGVKVKSATTGALDLSWIQVDDIDHIEIVKGPQSTLYGSEAMAGVINIITKKGKGKPKASIMVETGSFSTKKVSTTISGSKGRWDYRVTGSFFDTEGFSAASSGTEDDGYTNRYFSSRLGVSPTDQLYLTFNLRYSTDDSELDSYQWMVGLVDDLNYVQQDEHYLLSLKSDLFITDWYEQILTVSNTRERLKAKDPDTSYNNYSIDSIINSIDWQNNLFIGPVTMTAGIEYREEKGTNSNNYDKRIDNKAAYLNSKLSLVDNHLVLNAGLRYDDHQLSGSKTTYRLGALYKIKEYDLRIRTNYATGFRAPSLNELFYPYFGNPSLKPEKSKGYEVGIEKGLFNKTLNVGVTYFYQTYKDLIQYDFSTFSAQNIGSAKIKGVEAKMSLKLNNKISIYSSYTNLDAVDEDTGEPLSRRPQHKVVSSISYSYGRAFLTAQHIYVSSRYDAAAGRDLSSYNLVTLSGRYQMNKNLSIFMRVDNLFDTEYEEAGGYGTAGVSVFGGFETRL